MVRRVFSYWAAARMDCLIGAVLLVISTGIELVQPWPVKWLVDYVFGNLPAPRWLALTCRYGIRSQRFHRSAPDSRSRCR